MFLVELSDKSVNSRLVSLDIVDANRILLGCQTPGNSFSTGRLGISHVLHKFPGCQLIHSAAGTRHNSCSIRHITISYKTGDTSSKGPPAYPVTVPNVVMQPGEKSLALPSPLLRRAYSVLGRLCGVCGAGSTSPLWLPGDSAYQAKAKTVFISLHHDVVRGAASWEQRSCDRKEERSKTTQPKSR